MNLQDIFNIPNSGDAHIYDSTVLIHNHQEKQVGSRGFELTDWPVGKKGVSSARGTIITITILCASNHKSTSPPTSPNTSGAQSSD
jgi:hypothetical protein